MKYGGVNMKKKLLLSLGLTSIVLLSATAGAFAASNMVSIQAFLNKGVGFKVDGVVWTPKDKAGNEINAITYKNTTYLPIRTAGEALGVEIGWDSANNMVWLGEGAAAAEGRKQAVFNVNQTVSAGPTKFVISKVTFEPSFSEFGYGQPGPVIILDVIAENTSNANINWYVNQLEAVLNTKEQIQDTVLSDYYITSEFYGKVKKTGKVIFPVKSSKFTEINEIKLIVPRITDDKFEEVVDTQEIIVKLK